MQHCLPRSCGSGGEHHPQGGVAARQSASGRCMLSWLTWKSPALGPVMETELMLRLEAPMSEAVSVCPAEALPTADAAEVQAVGVDPERGRSQGSGRQVVAAGEDGPGRGQCALNSILPL